MKPRKRTRVRRIADRELLREDWLGAARTLLIEQGIAAVKVERMAKLLGVTRGGFYWRFRDLAELHAALLEDWETTGTAGLEHAVEGVEASAQFAAIIDVIVAEERFNPRWDSALRDWARIDGRVEAAVRRVDDARIELFRRIFHDLGFTEPEALVRARVMYFHQVGYYALKIIESQETRRALLPFYIKILSE